MLSRGYRATRWFPRSQIVQNGGIANLAETDELIGAESYGLKNVKDLANVP